MAKRCEICGKGPMFGHAVSHSKHAVNRRFMPNISRRTMVIKGMKKKVNVCANCLRTLNKEKA